MASMQAQKGHAPEPIMAVNAAPAGFDAGRDLPKGFVEFLLPLHREFTPRQQQLLEKQAAALAASQQGHLPNYLPPSAATQEDWQVALPDWCQDQRNQMTGPADDAEMVE